MTSIQQPQYHSGCKLKRNCQKNIIWNQTIVLCWRPIFTQRKCYVTLFFSNVECWYACISIVQTAFRHILTQLSLEYPINILFILEEGRMNKISLSEGKMLPVAYSSCLANTVLTEEGIESFFHIYTAKVFSSFWCQKWEIDYWISVLDIRCPGYLVTCSDKWLGNIYWVSH